MNNFTSVTKFESAEVPLFLEKKSKNLVYFGIDNLYPFELIDLYNDSSTHNAIINGKVGYTVGNGLDSEDLNVKKWLSFANIDEDWTSLMKRLSLDYELFNGYAIEVIKTASGNQYHHLDFANIRLTPNGNIKYSDEWITETRTRNSKPFIQDLERYDPKNPNQKRGVIYHVDYRPNLKYYPLPVYVGSLAEIKTDVQIGDYWLNEVKNGFVGGTLIQHNNGVPETDEESKDFEKAFQEKFGKTTGTKIVHLFSPSKDHTSEITNLNGNDLHERYLEMSNRVKESIFIGHRVTNPILFGVKEAGQMGARNELDLAYEIFTNTYIAERQNTLLRTIKKLAFLEISSSDIQIIPLKPIDTIDLTSDIILGNLTREEIRQLIDEQTGLELQESVANLPLDPATPIVEGAEPIAEPIADADAEQKDASYNGAQISSALSIVEQVKNGILSSSQGKAFLMEFLRLSESAALKLLQEDADAPSGAMCSHFAEEVDIMPFFKENGVSAEDYDIVERFDLEFNSDGQPIEFATEVQDVQREILSFLVENPQATALVISQTLEIEIAEVTVALGILKEAGLLALENSIITLSPIGQKVAKAIKIPQAKIKYRYEERPNAPALKAGGKSRDFCADLMQFNRLYSRQEIDLLRNGMKSSYSDVADVWLARGGWYTPEGKDKTALPYCRHVWNQVLVRKKK
jgi:hypothetical protein